MSTQEVTVQNNSFEMILRSAIELPGIKINRAKFLRKELIKYFDVEVVEKVIDTNPAQAGLSVKDLERIAKSCINFETTKVTAISTAAGIPGGFAIAATIPADIAQFFGHIIRILQKLVYLYGWQELFTGDDDEFDDEFDDETANELILFMGVMFGVNAANATLAKIAGMAAIKTEKTLAQKALTKGTVYPIVKKVAAIIGAQMNKQIFAKGVGKLIPVIGGVVSGGLTFVSFKPMTKRLQKYLISLPTANVDFYNKPCTHNDNVIDIDFSDIIVEELEEDVIVSV